MAGPHEILGMSRLLGIATTEFLALYTDNAGTTLRAEPDGRCVFVGESGCRVHPRRPLVCRLYPLGRMTDEKGAELFAAFPKQDDCEADFASDGTIDAFVKSQGVEPYLEWSRRYGELYRRMMGLLELLGVDGEVEAGQAGGQKKEPDREPLSSWQDVDASLAEYCAAKRLEVPEGIEEAIGLHIQAMKEWLDGLEEGAKIQ